ncbi:uncharacterized protein LOC6558889 isoform X2 [Drosophila grimshawi]|uniref:uncharacterized protein LOC6558889 isoform X2 n=1 Tax=Drosophila grimshawi TaxID=7222 RepID=UPI000C86E918|nr:uncharacterized protein LOC6558889 isoform X2 [Drosophila grimshawi]
MSSKKIAPERRPFCDPRLHDASFRRKRNRHKEAPGNVEVAKKSGKRPLNDCPFFDLSYKFDELPLDPIKDFLLEKISHMQNDTIVGRCNREFDFHQYDLVNVKEAYDECDDDSLLEMELEDIVMPEQFEMLRDAKDHAYNFNGQACNQFPWIDKWMTGVRPSEQEIYEMTNQLLDIYCQRRVRIFYFDCGTRSSLWSNQLRRQYGTPSELIGAYNTPTARHLRVTTLNKKTKKSKFSAGDHYALRTPQECRNELIRVGKIIDDMIKPVLLEAQHNKEHGLLEYSGKSFCADEEKQHRQKNKSRCKEFKKRIHRRNFATNEEFLQCLKRMEASRFPYMAPLQPVEPEEQKLQLYAKYQQKLLAAEQKFTLIIQKRYKCLLKTISVLQLATYPSRLIRRAIRHIDPRNPVLQDAYRFILQEEIPNSRLLDTLTLEWDSS